MIVLAYAVLRKLHVTVQDSSMDAKVVETVLRRAFGHHSVGRILAIGQNQSATDWVGPDSPLNSILKKNLSTALRILLVVFDQELSRIVIANREQRTGNFLNTLFSSMGETRAKNPQGNTSTTTLSYEFLNLHTDKDIAMFNNLAPY